MGINGTAIVQIACGFGEKPQDAYDLAVSRVDTDRSHRLLHALKAAKAFDEEIDEIWTTGKVPYSQEMQTTLAELNQRNISRHTEVTMGKIFRQVKGLNAFSESYNACLMAKKLGITQIIVVSSGFYWEAYERLWEEVAERFGVVFWISKVEHNQGLVSDEVLRLFKSFKVRAFVRLAGMGKLGNWTARTVVDLITRKRGFPFEGHTKIE